MAKIDLEKLICSLAKRKYFSEEKLQGALNEQGLEYKDGEIVEVQKPKFKVGDTMRTLQEANGGYTDGMPVVVSIDNEYYHCTNELIAIKDQDDYEFPPINVKQKPSDKVEPNFNVGDWVVDNHGKVNQVTSVTDDSYAFTLYDGTYVSGCRKDYYHLWSIADAKDGDVLCDCHEAYDNPLIFILKKFEHVDFGLVRPSDYSSYCYLTAGDIQRFKEGTYNHEHNIKPATKEQRDLLFQKMKEAGYEWDAEKKKLKKIVAWLEKQGDHHTYKKTN